MIESYSFGYIIINGNKYTSDVIVFPDKIKSNWWRKSGHLLLEEDISEILKFMPEIWNEPLQLDTFKRKLR